MTASFRTALAALLLSSAPVLANDQAIVVFDASGSMWGQIGGKAKIEIARDTLKSVLSGLPADLDLGLMVYGHREKGSCQDIQLMVPPGTGNADAINKAVAGIRPKGMTPITASVRQAAEALKYSEQKATVILVTDGLETCDADPCALADELEKSGVDFTAHVVGFGLTKDEGKKIACLADRTGGKYFSADDARTLGEALKETVKAAAEPAPAPAPAPQEVAVDHLFEGTATLAEGGQPFTADDLFWEIRKPDQADGSVGATVESTYGGVFKPEVKEPGDYVVSARLGKVKIDIPVTLKAGEDLKQDFVLNAGIVKMDATRTEGGKSEPDASITLTTGLGDETSYGPSKFFVPAGSVTFAVKIGDATVSSHFDIKAGETVEKTVVVGAGVVVAKALYAPGGPAVEGGEIFFEVDEPKANIDGTRNSVSNGYGDGEKFDLGAGDYVLFARLGAATAEVPVSVKAGERTEATVILNAGVVGIKADGLYRTDIVGAAKSIDGKQKEFNTSYDADYNFTLPAGDYVLRAWLSSDSEERKEFPFTVKAGERTEVTATK
ncbi:vWA domain-containing protein [Oryzibacter oryziterrae]|uniref:vWA domain-containing protein n=1 Tax=Oryzibacter oryziterrae TaxID=2766474 RepID=UPI001F1CD9CC|nr:VWA domain-containing protein [Oryzibacter oryziterrae]